MTHFYFIQYKNSKNTEKNHSKNKNIKKQQTHKQKQHNL